MEECRIQDHPEILKWKSPGDLPAVDEEERRPTDTGLLSQPDVVHDMGLSPAPLDTLIEAIHVQALFTGEV